MAHLPVRVRDNALAPPNTEVIDAELVADVAVPTRTPARRGEILDAEFTEHRHTLQECSPLWETHIERPGWDGHIVTDPAEIRAIRKRVEAAAASRGAWRRRLRLLRRGA